MTIQDAFLDVDSKLLRTRYNLITLTNMTLRFVDLSFTITSIACCLVLLEDYL